MFLYPVDAIRITQSYGVTGFSRLTNWYRGHKHPGIDFGARTQGVEGDPIYAAGSGTITIKNNGSSGYGLHAIIEHAGGYTTIYGHLHKVFVLSGSRVSFGQQIGEMGGITGDHGLSTGAHLHFEVRRYGVTVNPNNYLTLTRMEFEERLARVEDALKGVAKKDPRFVMRAGDGALYMCNHEKKRKYTLKPTDASKQSLALLCGGMLPKQVLDSYTTVKTQKELTK